MAKAKLSVNSANFRTKIYLSLNCNTINSFLYVNGVTTQLSQAKNSEIKLNLFCLRKIPKDVKVDQLKKLRLRDLRTTLMLVMRLSKLAMKIFKTIKIFTSIS